jgi:hypothetical protein
MTWFGILSALLIPPLHRPTLVGSALIAHVQDIVNVETSDQHISVGLDINPESAHCPDVSYNLHAKFCI